VAQHRQHARNQTNEIPVASHVAATVHTMGRWKTDKIWICLRLADRALLEAERAGRQWAPGGARGCAAVTEGIRWIG
jgi:hypothetical protein